jgi:LytR cell envelope-related transcriptional attenuator
VSEVDDVDELDEPQRSVRPPLTPAQRRARRQAITLIVVCGLLLVSFLFAAAYYGGWFDKPKTASAPGPCRTAPANTLRPSQVKVNVYNASKRNGLARKVAGEMKDRGFVVGTIANDPLRRAVTDTAEVRYGAKGKAGAQLVSSEVPGSKIVVDKRKDASVDLVLGSTYVDLSASATATATAGSSASCTPTGTSTTTGTGNKSATKTATATKTKK